MKLAMYPVTNHEKIGVRWGLEGIEPEYILKNLGQKHPEEMVFTILINMSLPAQYHCKWQVPESQNT